MRRTPAVVLLLVLALAATGQAQTRCVFLHQSVGNNLLQRGGVRDWLAQIAPQIEFWDNYAQAQYTVLRDGDGDAMPWHYYDETPTIANLHALWTTPTAARDSFLSFDVIAFKSCYYPSANIVSDEMLDEYKSQYTDIIAELHAHPDKKFILMGFPPANAATTQPDEAQRARDFIDWLAAQCRGNVYFFHLFDLLADGDDHTLRPEYVGGPTDSHPIAAADAVIGPRFAACILHVASASAVADVPAGGLRAASYCFPNPFNPRTVIRCELPAAGHVDLTVHDLSGARVATLLNGFRDPGVQEIPWLGRDDAGRDLPSGAYFFRLRQGDLRETGRMVLVR
jgi:hypothetical protein